MHQRVWELIWILSTVELLLNVYFESSKNRTIMRACNSRSMMSHFSSGCMVALSILNLLYFSHIDITSLWIIRHFCFIAFALFLFYALFEICTLAVWFLKLCASPYSTLLYFCYLGFTSMWINRHCCFTAVALFLLYRLFFEIALTVWFLNFFVSSYPELWHFSHSLIASLRIIIHFWLID